MPSLPAPTPAYYRQLADERSQAAEAAHDAQIELFRLYVAGVSKYDYARAQAQEAANVNQKLVIKLDKELVRVRAAL